MLKIDLMLLKPAVIWTTVVNPSDLQPDSRSAKKDSIRVEACTTAPRGDEILVTRVNPLQSNTPGKTNRILPTIMQCHSVSPEASLN